MVTHYTDLETARMAYLHSNATEHVAPGGSLCFTFAFNRGEAPILAWAL
jgi:hypothetical protein